MKNPLFSSVKAETVDIERIEINRAGHREAVFSLRNAAGEIFRRHSKSNIEAMLRKTDRMIWQNNFATNGPFWLQKPKVKTEICVHCQSSKPDQNKLAIDARDEHLLKLRIVLQKALREMTL